MAFPIVPVAIGGGVLAVAGLGLRLRALSKKSYMDKVNSGEVTAYYEGGAVPKEMKEALQAQPGWKTFSPEEVASVMAAAGITTLGGLKASLNKDRNADQIVIDSAFQSFDAAGLLHTQQHYDALLDGMMQGINGGYVLTTDLTPSALARGQMMFGTPNVPSGAIGLPVSVPTVVSAGRQAIVTTNDPAPSGDLIIRATKNGTQIGGAEKGGTVTVLEDSDATWALISWAGGSRIAPCQGYAKKAFLKLI